MADKKYTYYGPMSAVTLAADADHPGGRNVQLMRGLVVSLPEDNDYVNSLVARKYLVPVEDKSTSTATATTAASQTAAASTASTAKTATETTASTAASTTASQTTASTAATSTSATASTAKTSTAGSETTTGA